MIPYYRGWLYNRDMNKPLDFLAIGDITTDAFIRLSDAWIETDNPKRERELCMRFGDKIPYEFVEVIRAVGNSSNAAVFAKRLEPIVNRLDLIKTSRFLTFYPD